MHSTWTDGLLAPTELMRACRDAGLRTVALTDHDMTGGVAVARAEAERLGVELVPGVELTTECRGREVHVLGYFFDEADAAFQRHLDDVRGQRAARAERIIARLGEMDMPLTMDDVRRELAPGAVIGRPHIARALVTRGHVPSTEEAFMHYLGNDGPAYVRREAPEPARQIGFVRDLGGVAVMAHPALVRNDDVIGDLVAAGLQGLECWTSCHTEEETLHYLKVAARHGLLVTGGSDYHGYPGSRDLGVIPVPDRVMEPLREAARS